MDRPFCNYCPRDSTDNTEQKQETTRIMNLIKIKCTPPSRLHSGLFRRGLSLAVLPILRIEILSAALRSCGS